MSTLRIVSWNVNSVRLRLAQIGRVVAALRPDVLCLQELKAAPEAVPLDALQALGFPHATLRAMKGYNGVAILARWALAPLGHEDWGGRDDARHAAAAVTAHGATLRIDVAYVPAGGDAPDADANPKFRHKLDFVADMTRWSAALPADGLRLLAGDLNIAPLDCDVWSHRQLLDVVSHTPVETAALEAMRAAGGWVDAVRALTPPPAKLYSWWSYRARDWAASDRGRRLDHVWASPALAAGLTAAGIHREARSWPQPSDHAPVWADVDLSRVTG